MNFNFEKHLRKAKFYQLNYTQMIKNILIILISAQSLIYSQWTQTSGPNPAGVKVLLSSGTKIFAGTEIAGIFASTNNGTSWILSSTGLTNPAPLSFAANSNFVFVGLLVSGVFRSSDGGNNWAGGDTAISNKTVISIFTSGDTIFAGTQSHGIYRSVNNGSSWQLLSGGLNEQTVTAINSSGNILMAAADQGIYYSTNKGVNWTVAPGSEFMTVNCITVAGSNVYAGSLGGILKSTSGGNNWTQISISLPFLTMITGIVLVDTVLFAGTSKAGVIVSNDAGENWVNANSGIETKNISTIISTPGKLIAGTLDAGVLTTTNGGSVWLKNNNGLPPGGTVGALSNLGSDIFAGTRGDGVFKTTNNGTNWIKISNDSNNLKNAIVLSILTKNNVMLAGTGGDGLYRSTNNGVNWTKITSGISSSAIVLSLAASGSNLIAGTRTNVVYSSNNGASWSVSSGTPSGVAGALAADSVNAFVAVASLSSNGVYKSTNHGVSWTSTSLLGGSFDIISLALNDSNVFAGDLSNGLYRSTNAGTNWTSLISNGFPSASGAFSVLIIENMVFAGTNPSSGGIYYSSNNGNNWSLVNQGLPENSSVEKLAANTIFLFSGTFQKAVWKRQISEIVGTGAVTSNVPQSYSLEQNYPNPFNPSTKIGFSLKNSSFTVLEIFDVLGSLISTPVAQFLKAGYHSITWNSSGLSSGVYFYRLKAGNYTATRKMVLEK
jgi:hypothetical protein